jgi:hypothetical protein
VIRRVVFEAPAQAEIVAAFEWYEQRSYGLGGDFLRAVAAVEERLARSSESQQRQQRGRRQLIRVAGFVA